MTAYFPVGPVQQHVQAAQKTLQITTDWAQRTVFGSLSIPVPGILFPSFVCTEPDSCLGPAVFTFNRFDSCFRRPCWISYQVYGADVARATGWQVDSSNLPVELLITLIGDTFTVQLPPFTVDPNVDYELVVELVVQVCDWVLACADPAVSFKNPAFNAAGALSTLQCFCIVRTCCRMNGISLRACVLRNWSRCYL